MDVLAALAPIVAELLAWDGCYGGTCVYYQGLRLPVRAEIHGDVVVHEVGRVAVQGCREQMHVKHVLTVC